MFRLWLATKTNTQKTSMAKRAMSSRAARRGGFAEQAKIEVVANGICNRDELSRRGRGDCGECRCSHQPEEDPRQPPGYRQDQRQAIALESHGVRRVHGVELVSGKRHEPKMLKDAAPGGKARHWHADKRFHRHRLGKKGIGRYGQEPGTRRSRPPSRKTSCWIKSWASC